MHSFHLQKRLNIPSSGSEFSKNYKIIWFIDLDLFIYLFWRGLDMLLVWGGKKLNQGH